MCHLRSVSWSTWHSFNKEVVTHRALRVLILGSPQLAYYSNYNEYSQHFVCELVLLPPAPPPPHPHPLHHPPLPPTKSWCMFLILTCVRSPFFPALSSMYLCPHPNCPVIRKQNITIHLTASGMHVDCAAGQDDTHHRASELTGTENACPL